MTPNNAYVTGGTVTVSNITYNLTNSLLTSINSLPAFDVFSSNAFCFLMKVNNLSSSFGSSENKIQR